MRLISNVLLLVLPWVVVTAADRSFEVMVYNVEMLFDVDGVSRLEDYEPGTWGPAQLDRKLAGISAVLRKTNGGRGPDIILFNEFEADQTPGSTVADVAAFCRQWSDRSVSALLAGQELSAELSGVPVEAWLAKRLSDDGLGVYQVVVGRWRHDPTGHLVVHTNAVFSRFPVVESKTHDTDGARGILEVVLDVDGHPLRVFANHWKSGASDPATELTRIGNARVLRQRLDEILRRDPNADVIVGGDFNSQYNQKQRYPAMTRTGINDVLGSQGDELALRNPDGPDLYNLWFELPDDQRGSDTYRGEWGTLMQILITPGLHDLRGVQYVDNSFGVAAFPGLNADPATRRPVRWQTFDGGLGYSDHFPITARFCTVEVEDESRWLALDNPSTTPTGPAEAVPVRLSLDSAINLSALPGNEEFRTAANLGRFFRVEGRVTSTRPFRIQVKGRKAEIAVWIHDPGGRGAFFGRQEVGRHIAFIGELDQYKGEWQFVIPDAALE